MSSPADAAQHWDNAYRHGDTTRSWFQRSAETSLRVFDELGIRPEAGVLDVGGGASTLVDGLLERGFGDVTVLDVSAEGLRTTQHRLGAASAAVRWVVADVLSWEPSRTWDVWHDRAVLHFFVTAHDRQAYLRALEAATHPGSTAVLATFAPDGPARCSGLEVQRYDAEGLAALLGPGWELVHEAREVHTTPAGQEQPFTWAGLRRLDRTVGDTGLEPVSLGPRSTRKNPLFHAGKRPSAVFQGWSKMIMEWYTCCMLMRRQGRNRTDKGSLECSRTFPLPASPA